jgi:hypothetical protein
MQNVARFVHHLTTVPFAVLVAEIRPSSLSYSTNWNGFDSHGLRRCFGDLHETFISTASMDL